MPTISSTTTLTLAAGQAYVFLAGSGVGIAVADPGGRSAKYSIGPQQTAIGPFSTSVSVDVLITSGSIEYRVDTDGDLRDQDPAIAAQAAAIAAVEGKSLQIDPSTGLQIGGAALTQAQADMVRAGIGLPNSSVIVRPGYSIEATHNSSGYVFIGHDESAGVQFYRGGSNIYLSSDRGATVTAGKGLPTGVTNAYSIVKMLRAFGLWWICALDAGDSLYKVYSCPIVTGNGALTWTARKSLATGTTGNISGALTVSADGQTLVVSEYSTSGAVPATAGGPSIYRSIDGTTFERVAQHATARHWHGAYEDPFNVGTWYALLGDGTTEPVWKSTDNAATFSPITTIPYGWDGVSISCSKKYIWVTGDVYAGAAQVAPVFVFDRAKEVPFSASSNTTRTIPVANQGVYQAGTTTSGSTTLSMAQSRQIPLTSDDVGRHIVVRKTSDASTLFVGTISAVSGNICTLSGNASASSGTDGATYIVDRNERYYTGALQAVVDPENEICYLHVDNPLAEKTGLPWRYALFAIIHIGSELVLLSNMVTKSEFVNIVGGYVLSGSSSFPVISTAPGV